MLIMSGSSRVKWCWRRTERQSDSDSWQWEGIRTVLFKLLFHHGFIVHFHLVHFMHIWKIKIPINLHITSRKHTKKIFPPEILAPDLPCFRQDSAHILLVPRVPQAPRERKMEQPYEKVGTSWTSAFDTFSEWSTLSKAFEQKLPTEIRKLYKRWRIYCPSQLLNKLLSVLNC